MTFSPGMGLKALVLGTTLPLAGCVFMNPNDPNVVGHPSDPQRAARVDAVQAHNRRMLFGGFLLAGSPFAPNINQAVGMNALGHTTLANNYAPQPNYPNHYQNGNGFVDALANEQPDSITFSSMDDLTQVESKVRGRPEYFLSLQVKSTAGQPHIRDGKLYLPLINGEGIYDANGDGHITGKDLLYYVVAKAQEKANITSQVVNLP